MKTLRRVIGVIVAIVLTLIAIGVREFYVENHVQRGSPVRITCRPVAKTTAARCWNGDETQWVYAPLSDFKTIDGTVYAARSNEDFACEKWMLVGPGFWGGTQRKMELTNCEDAR